MVKRVWKVYGIEGHRQRETWSSSSSFETVIGNKVSVLNFDKTGTHEYSIIYIESPTFDGCFSELLAQISDGVFENSRVGKFEEIEHIESFTDIVSTACDEWCKSFLNSISDVIFGSDVESSKVVSKNE